MDKLTIKEIREAVNGKLIAGNEDDVVDNVCTDSRKVNSRSLFVPIIGDVYDAHRFIPDVIKKKCMNLIVSDRSAVEGIENINAIEVKDTTKALQNIAAFYLRKLKLKTVAVTGSIGKTSTRDITYAILSEKYKTGTTVKNYNNDIGVPLTIFGFDSSMEAAVLEVGMDHPGEIHRLVNIIRPDTGIITYVGVSHIENLGSRENIRAAKMEIADYFGKENHLILNRDNDMLENLETDEDYEIVSVGSKPYYRYYVHDIKDNGVNGVKFVLTKEGKDYHIDVPVPGAHNAVNASLAIAACETLGVSVEEAVRGIRKMKLTEKRLAITNKNGIQVIDDTYNASPESMKSAINTLMKSDGRRKIAILGGMNELGADSSEFHREVGEHAALLSVDLLITIGRKALDIAEGARDRLPENRNLHFETKEDFYQKMENLIQEGDTILVKASRGFEMEQVVEKLIGNEE